MAEQVKTRRYDSVRRRAAAERTRTAVLRAARDLFTEQGFEATTVAEVARAAGVSVDTVYASVGRKPELLLAVVDMALAGGDEPLPAQERGYVQAIRAAPTAAEKISVYARALAELMPRTAPLLRALDHAARTDAGCAIVAAAIDDRRADHMRAFVAELRAAGGLRPDLDDADAVVLVWSTNSWQWFLMLRARGVGPDHYAELLEDLWRRTLLAQDRSLTATSTARWKVG